MTRFVFLRLIPAVRATVYMEKGKNTESKTIQGPIESVHNNMMRTE